MPNTPSVGRSGHTVTLDGFNLTPAEARSIASQLTASAAAVPAFAPVPGTFTVKAPVSSKAGNNVLHGVKSIEIGSDGRVYCYMANGNQPLYEDGSQHESFSPSVIATKGPSRGMRKNISITFVR